MKLNILKALKGLTIKDVIKICYFSCIWIAILIMGILMAGILSMFHKIS